jgi:hypothetical protein
MAVKTVSRGRTMLRLEAMIDPSKLADPVYVEFLRLADCLPRRDVQAFLPALRRLVATLEPPCSLGRRPRPHRATRRLRG